jgi:hypothetical protein
VSLVKKTAMRHERRARRRCPPLPARHSLASSALLEEFVAEGGAMMPVGMATSTMPLMAITPGQHLADHGLRHHVAIADRGHGRHAPPHGARDAAEPIRLERPLPPNT